MMIFSDTETYLLTLAVAVATLFGSVTNGLMIFGIANDRRLLEINTNVFLLSQGIADLGICTVTSVLYIVTLYNEDAFPIFFQIARIFAVASVLSIVAMTANRLASIVWPFRCSRWFTRTKASVAAAFLWLFSVAIRAFDFTDYASLQRLARYTIILAIVVFAVSNVVIYRISVQKRCASRQQGAWERQRKAANLKFHGTILLLMITYIGGWLPVTLVAILIDRDAAKDTFRRYLLRLAVIAFFSSATDPLIYYLRSRNFRRFVHRFRRTHTQPRLANRKPMITFTMKRNKLPLRVRAVSAIIEKDVKTLSWILHDSTT